MNQQLTRVTDTNLVKKTDVRFARVNLEVAAECFDGQVSQLGDFLQVDSPVAFAKGEFEDCIHATFFVSGELAREKR